MERENREFSINSVNGCRFFACIDSGTSRQWWCDAGWHFNGSENRDVAPADSHRYWHQYIDDPKFRLLDEDQRKRYTS